VHREKANVIEYFSYLLRLSRLFPGLNTANWFTGWPIRKPWQIVGHQGVKKKRFLFAEILSMHASDPSPSNDHQTNFDLWQSSSFDYCCQGKAEKSWSQGVCVENIFIFHSNSMLIYLHNKPHFLPSLAARSSIIYQETGDRCPFFLPFLGSSVGSACAGHYQHTSGSLFLSYKCLILPSIPGLYHSGQHAPHIKQRTVF